MLRIAAINALRKYRGMKPEEVADREGIEVKEVEGLEHFDDAIIGKTILIPKGLIPFQKRWRIAHCLGHYFMHEGNQVWLAMNKCSFRPKQERQANVFAACLLTKMDYDYPWTQEDLLAVKMGGSYGS